MRMGWPLQVMFGVSIFVVGCAPMPKPPDVGAQASQSLGGEYFIKLETSEPPTDAPRAASDALTLNDALAHGLAHDSNIQASLARVQRAYAEAHQARLLPNPIITIALRFPESKGDPIIEAGLAANLMAALQAPWQAGAADQRLRVASEESLTVVLDAAAEIQHRYLEAQTCEAILPVLEKQRELAAQLVELARSRLRGGEGARLDLHTAESELIHLDIQIDEHRLTRKQARLQLARSIGRPSEQANWRLDELSSDRRTIGDERAWIAAAMEHRPELSAKRWELAALGVEDRLTRLALLEGAEPGIAAERDGEWSVGPALALPLPIFDWGQAKQAAVEARRIETMHLLTKAKREIVEEVRLAWSAREDRLAALDRIEKSWMPALERRHSDALASYRAGHSDITPVTLADQDLQTARAKRIEIQQKIVESMIRLHRAVGGANRAPASSTQPAAPAK